MPMSSARQSGFQLHINDSYFDVAPEDANIPLATFIRTKTHFKSVKVACGEGGCGACAVAVHEERDGRPYLRTINACLAPVYSVFGRSLVTAEGLPAVAPGGTSLVAERLSEFHASQCGFCTPGFTVACHAALHNAASCASAAGCCPHPAAAAAAGGEAAPPAGGCGPAALAEGSLLRELDGNLCRCTGYRPIVAACRSLATEVADIEDLCRSRPALGEAVPSPSPSPPPPPHTPPPVHDHRAQQPRRSSIAPAAPSSAKMASGAPAPLLTEVSLGPRQVLKVPNSLEQLIFEAGRLAAADAARGAGAPSWRLVAGHTGHGIYKDWPHEQAVLLSVTEVPELQRLELGTLGGVGNGSGTNTAGTAPYRGGSDIQYLRIGAAVTLERLASYIAAIGQQPAAAGGDGGEGTLSSYGARQWATETSAHLYRIAGHHVRNSATVGGNLTLLRERALPSDVATLLAAAGAEVELAIVTPDAATHGSVVRADLLQFIAGAEPVNLPAGASYILTAAHVPLPPADPRVRFWCHRVGERYSNAAAVANVAVLARLSAAPSPSAPSNNDVDAVAPAVVIEDVRIVIGLRTPGGCDGDCVAAPPSVVRHNAAKLHDVSAVLLHGWQCIRADAAEAALRNQPATAATTAAALEALAASDLALAATAAAAAAEEGEDLSFQAAVAIVQGLVAQGLMACLGLTPAAAAVAPPLVKSHDLNVKHASSAAHSSVCVMAAAESASTGGGSVADSSAGSINSWYPPAAAYGSLYGVVLGGGGDDTSDGDGTTGAVHATASSMGGPAAAGPPERFPPPPLVRGRQHLPQSVPELHPVTLPIPKLGSKLQASGTALYTEDIPLHDGALYGNFVLTARAGPRLAGIDTAAALAMPGVVRFLGAADLPGVGSTGALNMAEVGNPMPVEPVFLAVGEKCDFAGQVVGVVLANSPWTAQRAAKAVRLLYDYTSNGAAGADGGGAVVAVTDDSRPKLTIADAVRAKSFYPIHKIMPYAPAGSTYGTSNSWVLKGGADVDAVLRQAAAPPAVLLTAAALRCDEIAAGVAAPPTAAPPSRLRVVSGRYSTPSQLHFFLETQTSVAWPDEDGCVVVYSSTQSTDFIQVGVAAALQLPYNKVLVRCRRAGGGFGGKVTLARRVAVVTAIAAVATGRQVRISVPRNTDLSMSGGRCATDVSYVAVLEDQDAVQESEAGRRQKPPTLRAMDLQILLQAGAYLDLSQMDAYGVMMSLDTAYDIPAFRAEIGLTRCNLPPRTAVRGPGEITGMMIMEQIMEHVVEELGLDPEAFRQAHLLKPPPPPAAPGVTPAAAAAVHTPSPPPAASAAVRTTLGKSIPLRLYTLPYMWEQLKRQAGWEAIKAEVEAFNAANMWRKRGVAIIPTRYGLMRGNKPAFVSLLGDGTVQVACHGAEIGQGLWTKVAQVAALTLSEVLPPSRRPLDLSVIRIADNSTEVLPNSGVTGGSTASEQACAAVRLACLKLVVQIREHLLPKLAGREDYSLKDLAAAAIRLSESTVPLSAFAWGGQAHLPESSSPDAPGPVDPTYHVMGVALGLVEVDVLTGDRRVLRADIMFDLGRPVNPAVDVGQVEGAFVQGMGMMLQEEATYDSTTGALVQNSTWSYKPPSVSCAPQQLNVYVLNNAPLASAGPVSSKACGEPPLLLSYVVLAALQRATAAARAATSGIGARASADGAAAAAGGGGGGFMPLRAPATVERVRLACGDWSAAELLRRSA